MGWNHQLEKLVVSQRIPPTTLSEYPTPPVLDFTGWKVLHGGGGKVDERKQSDGQKEASSNL